MNILRSAAPLTLFAALYGLSLVGAGEPAPAPATQPAQSPFVIVFIDTKTEKALGPFPYDRAIYAKAVEKAAASGARGLVLKFFIDKPKTPEGDRALVLAMTKTKVILQARLDDTEPSPNAFPEKFRLAAKASNFGQPMAGKSGWIPLPDLCAAAHDVGFIDYHALDRMPLVEQYGDAYVKSLYLCSLEMAFGKTAEVTPGKSVRIGAKTVEIDQRSEVGVDYPTNDDIAYIPFVDFIGPDARPEVKDRVVILAYDSERFEPVETPRGVKIRPHRVFCYALMSLYRTFR